MWTHDCKLEGCIMSVGDGEECNWCGERAEDRPGEFGELKPAFPDPEDKTFDAVKATQETLEQFDMEEEIMNEDSISNVEVKDNPDGSANVTMDLTPETQQVLMKQGLQYLIEEMKMADKVVVLEPNEFLGETKTWELSDDDANALFHFGFIHAIKLGMEK